MTSETVTQGPIPFFRYPHLFHQQRDEILSAMVDVMERGAYILQRDLVEFEAALARYLEVPHALGVANGTDALILALRAAGVGPGDEVISPSQMYVATAARCTSWVRRRAGSRSGKPRRPPAVRWRLRTIRPLSEP